MTEHWEKVLVVLLAVLIGVIVYAVNAPRDTAAQKELTQAREKAAINLCVDNGGQAQFRYDQGADHLVFTGCTFSKGQEHP